MSATPKLFQPVKIGKIELAHRVVLAPLTRFRANKAHIHTDLAVQYYAQRSSTPGTLLITEATIIQPRAGGLAHAPGIWSEDQIAAWKKVTDAVHANKSYIFCQLWALGRAAYPELLAAEDPSFDYVSASDVKLADKSKAPRPLTVAEIKDYVQWYATAAANAVHRAGFDGVEIHGANGYLVHQFLEDVSNHRTDEYGGSIENRSRFGLEVVDAVTKAVGADKVAIRLSPWNTYQEMRMKEPKPTYTYFVQRLKELHSDLAYIHLVEARDDQSVEKEEESNDFIRDIWSPRPIVSAGGYNAQLALEVAEKKGDLIAFGRYYIANPDLPLRLQKNLPLQEGDRSTYYSWETPKGYIDYPFYNDVEVAA